MVVFLLGRELATHDLIPLNLLGLFFGTTTLYNLVYAGNTQVGTGFFSSETFTVLLLTLLVAMSIWGIALSCRYFTTKKEEVILSLGYLVPLAWFIIQTEQFTNPRQSVVVISFVVIAVVYFFAWYMLRPLQNTRYQHIAVYAGGIIALILGATKWFPDMNLYTSLLIAYGSLVFMALYYFDTTAKGERLLSAVLFSGFGAVMALSYIYIGSEEIIKYPTTWAVISLIPAMLLLPGARSQQKTPATVLQFLTAYSGLAFVIAVLLVLLKFLDMFDLFFVLFILPGFAIIVWTYFMDATDKGRKDLMPLGVAWMSVGFFTSFIYLVANLAPHMADETFFFKNGEIWKNAYFFKALIAMIGYFLALSVSRDIQRVEKTNRPSFLLVILGYTTLLLLVNFAIITICNDLDIAKTTGGIRAIGTTLWWIILAITMIMIGVSR